MNRLLILLLLSVSLAFSACQKKEAENSPKMSAEEVKKEVNEAAAVGERMKQEREEFISKTQNEMDELSAKMKELKHKAQTLTGEAKVKLDQQIQNLEPELKAAELKLADLKSATGDKWNELKAGASDTVEHLKQSFQKAED